MQHRPGQEKPIPPEDLIALPREMISCYIQGLLLHLRKQLFLEGNFLNEMLHYISYSQGNRLCNGEHGTRTREPRVQYPVALRIFLLRGSAGLFSK